MTLCSFSVLEKLIILLKKAGLPINLPISITRVEISTKMKHDKKHSHQGLQWVLLKEIGKAYLCEEVTAQELTQALERCAAKQ